MITFRPFRNGDPPALAEVWRQAPATRGLAVRASLLALDDLVFSKPYFDRRGLILAHDDDRPIGFVHAGFGPNETYDDLDRRRGVVAMLITAECADADEIGSELLHRAEEYLSTTAKEIFAIGIGEISPFYLGLYGGSDLSGVLQSDEWRQKIFRAAGYEEVDQVKIFQRHLIGFRPPVDRHAISLRRTSSVRGEIDAVAANWWQACTRGSLEVVDYHLELRDDNAASAKVSFWSMEALASAWGQYTVGMSGLVVSGDNDRDLLAKFLVAEAMKHLSLQGASGVEGQAMQGDTAAITMFEQLGFHQIDTGTVLRK